MNNYSRRKDKIPLGRGAELLPWHVKNFFKTEEILD